MYLDYSKLEFDAFGCPEEPELVLETMDERVIGIIPGVSELKINIKFTEVSELSFDTPKMLDVDTPNPLYDEIAGFRLIYTKYYGIYVIMSPEEESDGISVVKHVTAQSLEKTLDQRKFFLEEGTICLYAAASNDTLVGRILEIAKGWRKGYISTTLIGKYRTFDTVDEDLMSFMYNTLSEKFRCVFVFDTYEKTINIYDADEERGALPIYLDFDNLLENIEIDELSDEIVTAIRPYGADELTITEVNPIGTNWIYDLSYFIEIGDVPTDLATKWKEWQRSIYANQDYYSGLIGLQVSTLSQLRIAETELVDLKGELTDLTNQQSALIEVSSMEQASLNKTTQEEKIKTLAYTIIEKKKEIAEKEEEVAELEELAEGDSATSYLSRIKAVTDMLDIDKYFTDNEYQTLSKYFIEEDITESSFVATDLDENAPGELYDVTSCSFSSSDSTIMQVTMSRFNKNMYTFSGGTFSVSGKMKLSGESTTANTVTLDGDIIRGTLEVRNDKTFVISIYSGTLKATNTEAPSGMLVFEGTLTSLSTDVRMVNENDVITYEGTSLSFKMSSAQFFLTANISDYKRYSVSLELFEYARKTLHDLATPTYEFSVDSGNFLFTQEFEPFRKNLELGKGIYLRMPDDSVMTPLVIEIELDFEDRSSFSLIFSNRFKRKDNVASLKDMLEKSYSSGRNFDASKYLYNQSSSTVSEVRKFISDSLDVAKNTVLNSKNQSVVIDGTGITVSGLDEENAGVQLRIVNGMIAFTDDNWTTGAKLALGHFYCDASSGLTDSNGNPIDVGDYWGINAEVVGGNLIVGNNLVLESENADDQVLQFRFDASGAWLSNATFVMQNDSGGQILLDPRYGIAAGSGTGTTKRIYTINGTKVTPTFATASGIIKDDDGFPKNVSFYLDIRNGNAYFRGAIKATSGNIGGWEIADSLLHSDTTSNSNYVALCGETSTSYLYNEFAIWAGNKNPNNAPFWVKKNGDMKAKSGTFSGTLQAASFKGTLKGDNASDTWLTGCGIKVGSGPFSVSGDSNRYSFVVKPNGDTYISGDIRMTSGSITWGAINESGSAAYQKATQALAAADAAQRTADAAATVDEIWEGAESAARMFDALTSYGTTKGIFFTDSDGLFINADYIRSKYTATHDIRLINGFGGFTTCHGMDSTGATTNGCMMYAGSDPDAASNYCMVTNRGSKLYAGDNRVVVTGDTINLTAGHGGVYCNGGTILTSDRRLKTNITRNLISLEDMYMRICPVGYRRIDSTSGRTHVGFIAQEVEKAIIDSGLTTKDFAAFVRSNPDDYDPDNREFPDQCYLRYDEFIPLNTYMIQKLYKRIEALEAKVASMENTN